MHHLIQQKWQDAHLKLSFVSSYLLNEADMVIYYWTRPEIRGEGTLARYKKKDGKIHVRYIQLNKSVTSLR